MLRLTALTLLLVLSCAFAPEDAEPWTPPDAYRAIWTAAEACSGKRGDFDRVTWYRVVGETFPCPKGSCLGHWEKPHTIYLGDLAAGTEWMVRHEMIHDLLGRPGHPGVPFSVPCKALWEDQ